MSKHTTTSQGHTASPRAQRPVEVKTGASSSEDLILQRAIANPSLLSASDVKVLQRTVGNRVTRQLLTPLVQSRPESSSPPVGVQRTVDGANVIQRNGGKNQTTAFSGQGQRLGEGTFASDEERDKQRREAYARAQSRYSSGLTPFETKTDTSGVSTGNSTTQNKSTSDKTSSDKTSFSGTGHRLSEWTFESDEERESERREVYATAQSRYSAGLAPFEGERDISRIPSAPVSGEMSSTSSMSSFLSNAIRSRRPFTSGATEADIDPVSNIQNQLIPNNPNHNFLKSEMRKRRQFSSGASSEYVELKEAINSYDKEVRDAIRKYASEQPKTVDTLKRLWMWLTTDIDDDSADLQHRHRQLSLVQELLIKIEQSHVEHERRLRDAELKRKQELINDIKQLILALDQLQKENYDKLTANKLWWQEYKSTLSLFEEIKRSKQNQTEENFSDLVKRLKTVQQDAQNFLGIGSTTSGPVKIGLDPFDPSDINTIYEYYGQTGGFAPKGQVLTVCQKAEKYGGTYTYKGKTYDMYHDSHGTKDGNPNESKTAWKILVGNKLQVVGIGHHIIGAARYEAIFPFATDSSLQEYGPSPDITDSRT